MLVRNVVQFAAVLIVFAAVPVVCAKEAPVPARIEFNRDVRPILSDNCFHCHGPDKNAREADLRLDLRDEATKPTASDATPIVAGKPAESEVVRRILSTDEGERMPPADSHKTLTARQKKILERWIEQGAEYQQHWSFEPPVKAKIPADRNGVDHLVQKRLAEIGLKPVPEADRRTLIRRLYFDLLGLPPTPEEVAAFVGDTSTDAYEKLVDRVLANPHYGERMALGWLDVVRYADTVGYHADEPQNVWPYRDWVIQAFNDNMPYDRFTIEQLAGDLVPNANQETLIGSAFNRLLLTTTEGGAQPKDYEARYLTDRVRAVGTVWMGMTTGCAQCHDHKFDPFTARDFYSLGAFFADIKEGIVARREDGMTITSPDVAKQLAALDSAIRKTSKGVKANQRQWERNVKTKKVVPVELKPESTATAEEKKAAEEVVAIASMIAEHRNLDQRQKLRAYFLRTMTKLEPDAQEKLLKLERERAELYGSLPKVLISAKAEKNRIVRILPRGNWMDETGEIVQPALPHFLPQPKVEGRELTRLDLAEWLVARDNPLTARTEMNRLWQQFFGIGISRVPEDLGAQGEPPVNPPLLDWLACEFVDSGWDVKHMVRTIVTSHAYRQSSAASPELLTADPLNREVARQSSFRLDAELVRDNALSIAGLLSPKIGGASVKPYQPDRYWEDLNFPRRDYVTDTGESQYRRGMYVWRQRTFPHPSMLAFDGPSHEACVAERTRANIPQQALVLLNDPTYVEAARAFAARILKDCANMTADDRIKWAWQQTMQRDPTSTELETARALLDTRLTDYRADGTAAEALLKTGLSPVPANTDRAELAAWTHVARVLLNLHETITRS
jgi:hypothetical protein